jgi:hypothetical protein
VDITCIENYTTYFKESRITGVVRLNDQFYDPVCFAQEGNDTRVVVNFVGIDHLDIPFIDGSVPSSHVVNVFFEFMEKHSNTAVFVHCRQEYYFR